MSKLSCGADDNKTLPDMTACEFYSTYHWSSDGTYICMFLIPKQFDPPCN